MLRATEMRTGNDQRQVRVDDDRHLMTTARLYGSILWLALTLGVSPLEVSAEEGTAEESTTEPSPQKTKAPQKIKCETHQQAYQKFFSLPATDVKLIFDDGFLQHVPESSVRAIRKRYLDNLGAFKQAASEGEADAKTSGPNDPMQSYKLIFERGRSDSKLHLSGEGLIDGLWFGAPIPERLSYPQIIGELSQLVGTSAALIIDDQNQVIAEHNAGLELAVGSSFKLYVLSALQEQVNEGNIKTDQVVKLQSDLISLPSGILQDWPVGSALTVDVLAHLMISRSDNTATDHLIHLIGRDKVESVSPPKLRPFLSTRELFLLKLHPKAQALNPRYQRGDLAERRAVIQELSSLGLENLKSLSKPIDIQSIEWHVSTRQLCEVMFKLNAHSSLTINRGLAQSGLWSKVAYKGGSEPGVLNYTHLVQVDDLKIEGAPPTKRRYCISATINNPNKEVDTQRFSALVGQLIAQLERDIQSAKSAKD